jgi:hypothetical protein
VNKLFAEYLTVVVVVAGLLWLFWLGFTAH